MGINGTDVVLDKIPFHQFTFEGPGWRFPVSSFNKTRAKEHWKYTRVLFKEEDREEQRRLDKLRLEALEAALKLANKTKTNHTSGEDNDSGASKHGSRTERTEGKKSSHKQEEDRKGDTKEEEPWWKRTALAVKPRQRVERNYEGQWDQVLWQS